MDMSYSFMNGIVLASTPSGYIEFAHYLVTK